MKLNKARNADTVALAGLILGADCAIVAQLFRRPESFFFPPVALDAALKRLLDAKLVVVEEGRPRLVVYTVEHVRNTLGAHAAALVCTPV